MIDYSVLKKSISGAVILPTDNEYKPSLKRWGVNAEKDAAVVVRPRTSQEVSNAILFAQQNALPLTALGGGHSTSGTSSLQNGMVIDLCNLRSVCVDAHSMSVSFGGGCLWSDLDNALVPLGFATVGGIVNHTGVGGLILGGGHGYLTPKHGLTIDVLLSVEIVLANGDIVEASDSQNQDLFWAVRGAGVQFGIVTRFTSQIFHQGSVWSGTIIYSLDTLPEIIQFANDFHNRHNTAGHGLVVALGYRESKLKSVFVTPFFHGDEDAGREYFFDLFDPALRPYIDHTRCMTMDEVNTLINPISQHGLRRLMGGSSMVMPADPSTVSSTADHFFSICDSHPELRPQSVLAIEVFPTNRIVEVPLDQMAYANRGPYYDALLIWGWEDPALDEKMRKYNRELGQSIKKTHGYQRENESSPVGAYVNVQDGKAKPEDIYGLNLPRLKELKKKYDPNNVFSKWHGIIISKDGAQPEMV